MKILFFAFALAAVTALASCGGSPLAPSATRSDSATAGPSFSQFSDIPVPAKATMDVSQSLLLGTGESWVGRLVYTTWSSSAGDIFDLYKAQMPAYGWREITSVRAAISVQTWQRADRVATVQIRDTTLGEETMVTVAPAMGPGSGSATAAQPSRQPLR
jgi:hypothetical protein